MNKEEKTKNISKNNIIGKEKQQLKEFIDILVENSVASIFFDPITSAVKTAMFSVENAIASTKELIKGVLGQIPTLIIPGLKFNYDQFMHDWDSKLSEVEKKYGSTLKEVFDALKDRDMWGIGFLLYPEIILGQKLLFAAPEVALRTLEVLSGGDPRITSMRERYSITPRPWPGFDGHSGGGGGGMGSSYSYSTGYGISGAGNASGDSSGGSTGGDSGGGFGESIKKTQKANIQEQPQAQQSQMRQQPQQAQAQAPTSLQQELQALLADPSFKQKIAQNPFFNEIKQVGISTWKNKINEIDSVVSLEDPRLNKMFGDAQFINKIKNELNTKIEQLPIPEKTSEEDKKKAKEAAIKEAQIEALQKIKEEYKKFYKQKLDELVKQNPNTQDEARIILGTSQQK